MSPAILILLALAGLAVLAAAVGAYLFLLRPSPPPQRADAERERPLPPPEEAEVASLEVEAEVAEAAEPALHDRASVPSTAPPEQPAPSAPPAEAAAEPEPEPPAIEAEPAPAPEPAPVPAPDPEASAEPTAEARKAEVAALRRGLASTRGGFIARLAQLFGGKKEIDPALLDEIQEVLITADIGVATSDRILEELKARLSRKELSSEEKVWEALRAEARAILEGHARPLRFRQSPSVILVVGVNGVGKTTTIGKLASRFKREGLEVILAAGDTFRAAAVPQLEVWGRRTGAEVVKGKHRADPSSVVFDAIKKAQEKGADLVIADTAGRLHTKSNLMEELKKVHRSGEKALGRPLDEILLVLDSTTGQNAVQQAQLFKDAIPVSGIALTKLDGTAKGGVILRIVDEHGLPVRFVGVGEKVEDLREFDATSFVEALFSSPDDEARAA